MVGHDQTVLIPGERVLYVQVAGKRDAEQEAEAQHWIEAVIGERFPPGKFSHLAANSPSPGSLLLPQLRWSIC